MAGPFPGDVVKVYWLEQVAADVPGDDEWLSAAERIRLASMRVPKRRVDWRLGRWTAKCAITAYLDLEEDLRNIELRAAPGGAPDPFIAGEPAALAISLSHCGGTAACAVAKNGVALGCDLEQVESRSDTFIADFFSPDEQTAFHRCSAEARNRLVNLYWSAKESALKALRVGLRLDTRTVVVDLVDSYLSNATATGWRPLHVCHGQQVIEGWWRDDGCLVRALVASPPSSAPAMLVPVSGRQQIRTAV